MFPVLPHLISECLEQFGIKDFPQWPEIDKKYLQDKLVNIVIQINGKKRGVKNFKKDITEKDLIKEVMKENELKKYFKDKQILKKFYVQNKIINFILK